MVRIALILLKRYIYYTKIIIQKKKRQEESTNTDKTINQQSEKPMQLEGKSTRQL